MKKLTCFLMVILMIFSACAPKPDKKPSESESPSIEASEPEVSSSDVPEQDSSSLESTSETDVSSETENSVSPAPPLTYTLVIPEGYTLPRIGMVLEEKGICTTDEFIEAAQNGDFSGYPLIAEQIPNPERCFTLEGYLFPDTYDIYYENTPSEIIGRILDHTEQIISAELRAEIAASGYTTDEILAMASIIEKEAFDKDHMPLISSVLHNRLDSGMRLQCDVTITYVEGAIKPFITGDKDRYNSFYNTYKCAGLPAGAICNPGIAAIKAALRPEATDYFYFVTDSDNNYYFAATWEEHEKNVAICLGDKDESE